MIFLIDCNGECACDKCMIDEPNLKGSKTSVKTFPEFYYSMRGIFGYSTIYQRQDNGNKELINKIYNEDLAKQIVDLLNDGTIKLRED